jgi:hypothetical protein
VNNAAQKVVLPFGVITPDIMNVSSQELDKKFNPPNNDKNRSPIPNQYVPKDQFDKSTGAHQHAEGRLHGYSMAVDNDGRMISLVQYETEKRDGVARFWDGDEARLYVTYKNGVKDGITCYFYEGMPHVAQLWKKGKLQTTYLIMDRPDGTLDVLLADDADDLAERDETILSLSLTDLDKYETTYVETEKKLKQALLAWYKAERLEISKQMVAKLSPQKHAATRARNAALDKANANAIGGMLDRGARASGYGGRNSSGSGNPFGNK